MKNKKTLIITTTVIVILLVLGIYFHQNNKLTNDKEVKVISSLMEDQINLEDHIKSSGYTLDKPQIILNPYKISPLTAMVSFETKEEVTPIVEIVGKDKHSTFTHTFKKSKNHTLEILGLYPDTTNKVIVKFKENNDTKTLSIKTDKLPKSVPIPTKVTADKSKLNNDLYFMSPSGLDLPCAYDVNGDVRWYLTIHCLWENSRLKNGHLLLGVDRLIHPPYYVAGMYEMDLLGKVYKEYKMENGFHHDRFEMENGNFLVASNKFIYDRGTVEDYVVEIDKDTGKIVKEWDLQDVLRKDDGKCEDWVEYDWFHNNAVWYDKKTNSITLSGRHKDAVINIDYDSGKLNWIIGDKTNWDKKYHKYFFKPVGKNFEWQWMQHAAMITPEGYVFLLDNGNNKSKIKSEYVPAEKSYTRGVMYKIDTKEMTIEQIWQFGKERGSKFYSPYISDVDYLDKNHYIVHSGGISYVDGKINNHPAGFTPGAKLVSDTVELLNDKIIYEIVTPTNTYRTEKMPMYIEGENHSFGKPKELGTLGKTEVDKKSFGFIHNVVKQDKDYEKREIKFTKESDRLTFNGKFKRGTKVSIYLYKNGKILEYKVPVSKTPYTALCVSTFTEEETKNGISIYKYINDVDLKGKYSIYLKIDDKIYNTNEYVNF